MIVITSNIKQKKMLWRVIKGPYGRTLFIVLSEDQKHHCQCNSLTPSQYVKFSVLVQQLCPFLQSSLALTLFHI